MRRAHPTPPPQHRVAIYTRQSVATDLEFGSIDAQREAVEAYVQSQRGEGWMALPGRYDDHGFSGGNTDRPAFQHLLADIQAGDIDVVAAYKIDRVSRSLADFTRFMELLEKHGVGFVSTTQSFDTRSSMGRLTLNILASFSQFERETIAERTRDKIAATRKKGMWTGGRPVLGYDVQDKALVINDAEAATVRRIFELYLDLGGLIATVTELDRLAIRNKSFTNQAGKAVRGKPFTKGSLRTMLTNPLYVGRIRCGEEVVDGQHEPIITKEVFEEVATALRSHRRTARSPGKWGAILSGILRCARCGAAMTHTASVRGNRTHRYYCCVTLQKRGAAACPGSRAPAPSIEEVVTQRVRGIGTDPEVFLATAKAASEAKVAEAPALLAESRRMATERSRLAGDRENLLDALQQGGPAASAISGRLAEVDEQLGQLLAREKDATAHLAALDTAPVDDAHLRQTLQDFTPIWDQLLPKEQARVLQLLIEEVRYDGQAGDLEIVFRDTGLDALRGEMARRRLA